MQVRANPRAVAIIAVLTIAPSTGMAGNGQFAVPFVFGNVAGAMQQMQQQQYQMQQQQIISRQQAGAAWLGLGQPILSCIGQNYHIDGPQFGYTYGIFPGDYRYVGMVQQCAAMVLQEQQRQRDEAEQQRQQEAERQRQVAQEQERQRQQAEQQQQQLAAEQQQRQGQIDRQRQITLQHQQQAEQHRKVQQQQTQQLEEADAIRAQEPNALSQMWSSVTGSSEAKSCLNFNEADSTLAMLCAGGQESSTALIGNVAIIYLTNHLYRW